MSFAEAPAAAAGTGWDGNAGENDQVASVSGVQAQPQAAIEFGDQAHPQAAVGSLQEFSGKQVTELVNEPKFSKQNHNFSGIQVTPKHN